MFCLAAIKRMKWKKIKSVLTQRKMNLKKKDFWKDNYKFYKSILEGKGNYLKFWKYEMEMKA